MVSNQFYAESPCTGYLVDYPHLGAWWDDRKALCDDITDTGDVDLLITKYDSEAGICVGNQSACAEGGTDIADISASYTQYGCTDSVNSMQTALHEVVDGLMDGAEDGFDEHKIGTSIDHELVTATTPMASPTQYNVCEQWVSSGDCWEMMYSDCCEDEMRHT